MVSVCDPHQCSGVAIQLEITLPDLSGLARYLDWTDSEGKNESAIEARESNVMRSIMI